MMKRGVAYEFSSPQSRTDFYNRMCANQYIVNAIERNNGQFFVGEQTPGKNYLLFKTGSYLMELKNSDNEVCVIREDEFHYFSEVKNAPQKNVLEKFDKAVASFRSYRSERPLSSELENALDMIRFGISIQD